MDHLQHCDALEAEVLLFAELLDDADNGRQVPSCPEWTVLDLAEHLGGVHRWAEYLVRNLAPVRIPAAETSHDLGPVDSTWIREGGMQLLATLRSSDPDHEMWAWGADQHVRFWSRRQLHETLIHRIDIQMATDLQPDVDPGITADAIDEFLVNLQSAAVFSPSIDELRDTAGRLAFRDSDTGNRWVMQSGTSEVRLTHDDGPVDVEFTANAVDLLLSLYRRRSLDEVDGLIDGDESMLRFWLDHSALE